MKAKSIIEGLVLLIATTSMYASPITGEQIMQKVYDRDTGNNMQANLKMEIMNSRGQVRERDIIQVSQEDQDGKEKKLMFFLSPADVKDTGFLSISYPDDRDDDQWIYLPALQRVKRIAAKNQNDSFMGSDFTYDDMGTRNPNKDVHTLLGTRMVNGQECYIVESIPKVSNKEFDKTVTCIVKDEWYGLNKEYHYKGEIIRELTINSLESIDGIYVITDMVMKNHDKDTQTRITMHEVSFDNNLDSTIFTDRQLKMGPRF